MIAKRELKRVLAWLVPGLALSGIAMPAHAELSTFDIRHKSGSCDEVRFDTGKFNWSGRKRIHIGTGEKISVRLYGNMAEKAEDAIGADIFEWIETSGYGWVDIHIRAAAEHGTGNRTVTVKWPGWMGGGTETIPLKIVASCSSLFGTPYRASSAGSATGTTTVNLKPRLTTTLPLFANLLPSVQTPYVLARPLGAAVPTPSGGMFPINAAFCANIAQNTVVQVPVPPLRWGVAGVNITLAAAGFNVQLYNNSDPDNVVSIATLPLPTGFPANTPQVHALNYPGRPTTIRVIANPRFVISKSTTNTIPGCFTAPGVTQPLDPTSFRIVVDTADSIDEGSSEHELDNELTF